MKTVGQHNYDVFFNSRSYSALIQIAAHSLNSEFCTCIWKQFVCG